MTRRGKERVRERRLLRAYVVTANQARRAERAGDYNTAEAIWTRNCTFWCELMEMGIDPDPVAAKEVA